VHKIICPFCGNEADESDKAKILHRILNSDLPKSEKMKYIGSLEKLTPGQLAENYEKELRAIYSEIGGTLIKIDRQRQREAEFRKCQNAAR